MNPTETLGRGAYCSRCNTIKPIAEFKRYLTNAEALSRGYAANYKVEVESSVCKACRPKPRPINKLRAGELRQRVASGDIDAVTAAHVLNKRNARAKLARKMYGAKQAQKKWDADLKALLKPMSAHITSVDNWLRYQTKKGVAPDAPSVVFMVGYLALLRRQREHIKYDQLMSPKPVTQTAWQQFTPFEERLELWKKWDALPPDERQRTTKTPPLLATYKE
jgi:hypothetical protein